MINFISPSSLFYACAYFLPHYTFLSQLTQVRTYKSIFFSMLFFEVIFVTVKEAVAQRFRDLCKERGIRTNELANRAGVTPSSVYSMLDPHRKEVSVNLVKKLCDGLEITLGEFFSTEIFDTLEQEIQ